MRNRYLKILGLKPGAEDHQIKQAYRKLAKIYHPDINNDPNSHQLFIKINEAYAKLTDDNLVDDIPSFKEEYRKKEKQNLSKEEFEKRMEWARNYARMKSIKEDRIVKISFIQIRKSIMGRFSLIVSIISIAIASIILIDYAILSPEKIECSIKDRRFDSYLNMIKLEILNPSKHTHVISIDLQDPNYLSLNLKEPISFYKSPILKEKIGISNSSESVDRMVFNYESLYVSFYFYVILLFLPIITLISRGPNLVYILSVYFITYMSLIVMIIFFLTMLFR